MPIPHKYINTPDDAYEAEGTDNQVDRAIELLEEKIS